MRGRTVVALSLIAGWVCVPAARATYPGDNGLIAVTHFLSPTHSEIYLLRPDGTSRTPLTSSPFSNWETNWSPDGTQLVFASSRDDGSLPSPRAGDPSQTLVQQIWKMRADGSRATALSGLPDPTTDPGRYTLYYNAFPSWSRDSSHIAYESHLPRGDATIYEKSSADPLPGMLLTASPDRVLNELPDFSPDNDTIAFARMDGTGDPRCDRCRYHLWGLSITGAQTQLTSGTGDETAPDFSPDGRQLAFIADSGPADSSSTLEVMAAAPGAPPRVVARNVAPYRPAWSPDGTKIAYTMGQGGVAVVTVASPKHPVVVDRDTADGQPSWQPLPRPVRTAHLPPPICSQACLRDFRLRRFPDDTPLRPAETLPLELFCPLSAQLGARTAAVRGSDTCTGVATLRHGRTLLARLSFKARGARFITVPLRLDRQAALLANRPVVSNLTLSVSFAGRRAQRQRLTLRPQPRIKLACGGGVGSVGAPLSLTGSATGVPVGAKLSLVYEDLAGAPEVAHAVSLDRRHRFRDVVVPARPGELVGYVLVAATARREAATSGRCLIHVRPAPPPTPEQLRLTCPAAGSVGSPVSLTGALSPVLADARIVLTVAHPSGLTTTSIVTLDASGGFRFSYDPDRPGVWVVIASYGGDPGHSAAVSLACPTSVPVPPPTQESITATCDPNGTIGVPVTTGGTLLPPVLNASVTVQITDPNGATTSHSATVDANGGFSITFTPTSAGNWTTTAIYNGDAGHASATGPACVTAVGK